MEWRRQTCHSCWPKEPVRNSHPRLAYQWCKQQGQVIFHKVLLRLVNQHGRAATRAPSPRPHPPPPLLYTSLLFPVPSLEKQSLWQAGTITRRQHRRGRPCPSAHTTVDKAQPVHFRGLIDIAAIDQHRATHGAANLQHVERLEFIPFGHDNECIGILGYLVGVLAESNRVQVNTFTLQGFMPGLRGNRVVDLYHGTL